MSDTFRHLRTEAIPTLNLQLEEYEHLTTGARHIHLACDDDQNSFLIGFRTIPTDSTGVAHILEHTTLCGSEQYPVRDPFFMMTRRSLNTFMNALTSSDWTAYPFASRNRKDFDNLLRIYLDATLFPNLNPLDFAQEGHRLELTDPTDLQSTLTFKGVVFNEMKGAMSSPVSALWQSLTAHLFPTITYHYNSGGDPAEIPNLSYQQLKAFHARHYHPSNALLLSYGDIPAAELQQRFHELALHRFERKALDIAVPDEQRYTEPQRLSECYAFDSPEPTTQKSHIVLAWLIDRCTSAKTVLEANLLSGILLDNSASPLRQVLETTELGLAPSPLCGLSDSSREMFFACGLEGSDPEQADAVETLILNTLERLATEGVPLPMVESVLHQLELSQREVSGDGMPYGLQLIVNLLGGTLHGADPVGLLHIDPILAELQQQIHQPDYVKGLIRRLLDNPHRVRLVMAPDTTLSQQRQAAEQARLAEIAATLSTDQRAALVQQAQALAERQQQHDDAELLPKVGLEDIPATLTIPIGEPLTIATLPATRYSRGTNGLIYEQIILDLPPLTESQRQLLPLFADLMSEVGSGGRSYLETQAQQAAVTGGIGASISLRSHLDDPHRYSGYLVVSGKALKRNQSPLADLLQQTLFSPRFDEYDRLRELIAQSRMAQEQRVTGSGHALAMSAAASTLTPLTTLSHQWSGLAGIQSLKALDKRLNEPAALEQFGHELRELHQLLLTAPRQLLLVAEAEEQTQLAADLAQHWQNRPNPTPLSPFQLPAATAAPVRVGWATSTQVNFCAQAYPTVAANHPDAAPLTVLAGFLRNNYLHRLIREQGGAYGGGASHDNDNGVFRFYSYRDPRLQETLDDFERAVTTLLNTDHEWRLVEEAILGVIGSIDKPGSPAGEAKSSFYASLHGRTPAWRNQFRQQILAVHEADLKRVAERYLQPTLGHTAVVSDAGRLQNSGLTVVVL